MADLLSPIRGARATRALCGALVALAAGAALSGCVTVYQPLTSLQRPVVVDPQVPNFEGLRLLVRCIPGDYLDAADSQKLCRSVSSLFRNQGAEVDTVIPRAGGGAGLSGDEGPGPDLIIDLRSRLLHHDQNNLMLAVYALTFTLVPAVEEFTFAQDVTVRDPRGALLETDSLQGRFIRYTGIGIWAVNWALDLAVRPDEEELTGDAPDRDFSRDFYGQLSQLVFNARMKRVVLGGFQPQAPAPDAKPKAD